MGQDIYNQLKIFNFPDHLKEIKKGKIPSPIHVRIKPTNSCNHHCWYCAYKSQSLSLGRDMRIQDSIPELKMYEIIKDLIEMEVHAITFSGGGEPLSYPYLAQCLEKISKSKIKIGVITNGSLLTGKIADLLAEFGTWIRISMDSWSDESMMKARSVRSGEFEKIKNNIHQFSKRRSNCSLGISFIVDKNNYKEIKGFCEQMYEIGVQHVKISGCVVSDKSLENNRYHKEIRKEVLEQIQRAEQLTNDNFSIVNHYHGLDGNFKKPYEACRISKLLTIIGADTKIYRCQDW